MKKYLFILFAFIVALLTNNVLMSNDVNLTQYKIVNLHRDDSSIKVLSGVANIRLKASKGKMQIVPNNDFKIISQYLPDNRKISNQKERFNLYTKAQQQKILELEEILSRTFIVEFDADINVSKFCYKLLKNNISIEIAEPYYVNYGCGMPNDPEVLNQSVLSYVKAFEAWDICEGDSTVLIGVGDTGFEIGHKDLAGQIQFNEKEISFNGIDDDGNGYIDDYRGYNFGWIEDGGEDYRDDIYNQNQSLQHGLQVIGIIGAKTNNGINIAGVGNNCKLVPIRIIERNSSEYLYSYQSILYAAARGCKVLNCSWGAATHLSVVNQSIVDYAIACDVAIVASAGNMGNGVSNNHCIFYPAGYYGVLGVGGCDPNDKVDLGSYILGPQTRILAQAESNISLEGKIQTIVTKRGTSFAAPVVSGALGILRSYKPELSAQEAIELIRVTSDSVSGSGGFAPYRVNMYKALTTDADLIPSIILKEQYFETMDGEKIDKVEDNTSYFYVLKVKNILGDAKNINLSLEDLVDDITGITFEMFDNVWSISELKHNEEAEIKLKAKLSGLNNTNKEAFFKLCMSGENNQGTNFKDNFVFYVPINVKLNTIENEKLIVSISDDGIFGYNRLFTNIIDGFGVTHKQYGDFLYAGNLVAISENNKISTSFKTNGVTKNPLTTALLDEKNNINIIAEYTFPSETSSSLKTKLKINYLDVDELSGFAIGHRFDWDVNNNRYNSTGYFKEAIPDELDKYTAAAEFATDISGSVYVGSLAFINKNKYPNMYISPQASGSNSIETDADIIKGLTSGIASQTADTTDIVYIIGIQYLNPIKKEDNIECVICTGIGKTKEELANTLKDCAKSELTGIESNNDNNWYDIKVVDNKLEIRINFDNADNNITLEIFDLLGKKILTQEIIAVESIIDISNFLCGVYYVRLDTGNKIIVEKILH